jgi:CRISPR system Cascade subunit CasB
MTAEHSASPDAFPDTSSREARFVARVLEKLASEKGIAASLRRADNPATEYQSWDFLAGSGIDLDNEYQRLPFVTLAAAMAKAKAEHNGSLRFGQAIARCYEDGNKSDQAKAKLRRVLACDDLPELCRILRPVLALVTSRVSQPLDYVRLLIQLRRFHWDPQKIKAQWAQEFYGQGAKEDAARGDAA